MIVKEQMLLAGMDVMLSMSEGNIRLFGSASGIDAALQSFNSDHSATFWRGALSHFIELDGDILRPDGYLDYEGKRAELAKLDSYLRDKLPHLRISTSLGTGAYIGLF